MLHKKVPNVTKLHDRRLEHSAFIEDKEWTTRNWKQVITCSTEQSIANVRYQVSVATKTTANIVLHQFFQASSLREEHAAHLLDSVSFAPVMKIFPMTYSL
jgi:hypothetical protein